jgi:hypothetical protein
VAYEWSYDHHLLNDNLSKWHNTLVSKHLRIFGHVLKKRGALNGLDPSLANGKNVEFFFPLITFFPN